jgi:hypothetical protein
MLDPDRRKEMISLRLSEEEFELLKTRYHTYGARNVSELARVALQRMMTGPAAIEGGFTEKLADLDSRVHALESEISLIAQGRLTRL